MDESPFDSMLARRLAGWRSEGLGRSLRVLQGSGVHPTVQGRRVISFASNDYLGLSAEPRVILGAQEATASFGAGATASRSICGTLQCHQELEVLLAKGKRAERGLVFASGYHAALATIVALMEDQPGASIILDRLAHASLIDGAKLAGGRIRTFKHNDAGDLVRVLKEEDRKAERESDSRAENPSKLIVVESLYSMDGDAAPLQRLAAIAEEQDAWLLVDEAHATGVLGRDGWGLLSEVYLERLPPNVLSMGTLSKALGSQGGFLCASQRVIEIILHAGRTFLFSTGLAPGAVGAALASLRILVEEPERRTRLLEMAAALRGVLEAAGFTLRGGPGPIVPVVIGDEKKTVSVSEKLWEAGIWVPPIRHPTVKKGEARLRISLSVAHSDADLEALRSALGA